MLQYHFETTPMMLMHRIVADFSFLFLIDNKVADFQIWDNALTDDQLLKVKTNAA